MTNEGDRKSRFYTCSCFTTDNIFLEDYKLHVRFVSEKQFRLDYQPLLTRLGCVTEQQFVDVLTKVRSLYSLTPPSRAGVRWIWRWTVLLPHQHKIFLCMQMTKENTIHKPKVGLHRKTVLNYIN
ncbi:2-oxoglutarate and iron-dependent oxygenase domain-containing protein 2 [Characodon lateralis]|uniref:2-oxoglutarate and iron-dependent oxygenase domain-containing protein 2 n=1 Tax=Characodon lateralis TaxID=208331 RepID=A0ABU7EFL5_9TELE|nr:2-oxoglutarate and iron-dependent oxygenase domain-containing protein 2 [Characodon lateralis]